MEVYISNMSKRTNICFQPFVCLIQFLILSEVVFETVGDHFFLHDRSSFQRTSLPYCNVLVLEIFCYYFSYLC